MGVMIYLTKQPALRDDSTGRAGTTEIEITPAMIEAGVQAVSPYLDEVGDLHGLDIRPALEAALGAALAVAPLADG